MKISILAYWLKKTITSIILAWQIKHTELLLNTPQGNTKHAGISRLALNYTKPCKSADYAFTNGKTLIRFNILSYENRLFHAKVQDNRQRLGYANNNNNRCRKRNICRRARHSAIVCIQTPAQSTSDWITTLSLQLPATAAVIVDGSRASSSSGTLRCDLAESPSTISFSSHLPR